MDLGFLPLGWAPSPKATKAERARRRGAWRKRVSARIKSDRAEYKRLAKSARESWSGKKKLEALFHEVYGPEGVMQRNPRQIPEVTPAQVRAYERLIRGNRMANKRRRTKKKRNPRKGKMPAGLRKYWAAKRARSKNRRRRRAKSNPRPRVKYRTRTVVKYRTRTVKVRAKRRRHSNPRLRVKKIFAPKGLSGKGLQQFRRTVARLTGKRTRIVRS